VGVSVDVIAGVSADVTVGVSVDVTDGVSAAAAAGASAGVLTTDVSITPASAGGVSSSAETGIGNSKAVTIVTVNKARALRLNTR
jgi:hypothetical protein